jgi:hypothetical protein
MTAAQAHEYNMWVAFLVIGLPILVVFGRGLILHTFYGSRSNFWCLAYFWAGAWGSAFVALVHSVVAPPPPALSAPPRVVPRGARSI